MNELTEEIQKKISDAEFPVWQFELVWRLRNLKNRLLRHFELEERNSFRGDILIRSPDNLKKIQLLKSDHGEISADLAMAVSELRKAETHESPHITSAAQKMEELFQFIRTHEAIEMELINTTIRDFQQSGRYLKTPTFDEKLIFEVEKKLGITLPETYKTAVCYGSYDAANFSFIEPQRCNQNPHFVNFAKWNNITFSFNTTKIKNGEYPISVRCDSLNPEERYPDFPSWFKLIFEMANQPVGTD